MLALLSWMFFIVGAVLAYWLWVRPLLRARPELKEFYTYTDSWWTAFWGKLSTIKTRLSAVLLMISSGLVGIHDFLMPIVLGIDWTPLTQQVPAWVWPLVSFGFGALFLWFRSLNDKTQEKVVEAVAEGATIEQAKVIAGVMPAGEA